MTKNILLIALLLMMSCGTTNESSNAENSQVTEENSAGPQITNYETAGNLEVTNQLGCIDLEVVKNTYSMADIFHGLEVCMAEKEYDKAARLFAISGLYGFFDATRVNDPTAGQTFRVIQSNGLGNLSEKTSTLFSEALSRQLDAEGNELVGNCDVIKRIGYPAYHPNYMIQHGMAAFTGIEGNGLKPEFNAEETWTELLDSYLHCPAQ